MKQFIYTLSLIFVFCISALAQADNLPCPTMKIVPPESLVDTGQPMFFSVSISEEAKKYKIEYKWSVDQGTIVEGQNTSIVQIDTTGLAGTTVTASIEIKVLPKNCPNTNSDTGVVAAQVHCGCTDDYGEIPLKEEFMRFDNLMIHLHNTPNSQGFVVMPLNEKESIEDAKKHIQKLVEHIKKRKFPKEQITFAIRKGDSHFTRIYILSAGADFPECKNCEIIREIC